MPARWVLHRAGITNVYQYADETLHFAGGRLLLRGVNGSGKSTAMNMLLPFLLDADTRRIDAAGEQSQVLRSWMLSGREEQQPVGYLWVELRLGGGGDGHGADAPEGGDRYLVCGCGIRANRSTDRVTTWWFITDRRPGIDLALVEGRVPLSADALRATLGAGAVFAQDQRPAYRAEVRNRLYGGADLDQHIRLLHVVRNPRVGDRIDVDLPRYLEDALPQLSEAALEDAAQPLEDLEEHRRNVEDLRRTAATLDGLEATFRDYARSELRRRADDALATVAARAALARAEASARAAHAEAVEALEAAASTVARLEREEERLTQEIAALKSSEAYQQGAELDDLRAHVRSLAKEVASARHRLGQREARRADAATALQEAATEAGTDGAAVAAELTELAALTRAVGLATSPPDAPAPSLRSLHVAMGPGPGATAPVAVPDDGWEVDVDPPALADVRAAAKVRTGDVADVHAALDAAEGAERQLQVAEDALARAEEAVEATRAAFAEARAALAATTSRWREQLEAWAQALARHCLTHRLPPPPPVDLARADLVDARAEVGATLLRAADEAAEHHRRAHAELDARRQAERTTVAEHRARVEELASRTVPEPPSLPWQQPRAAPCLADLVDFAPTLPPEARAGLEAALEAAGLLSAEVHPDGTALALADGQLLVVGGAPVPEPLAAVLTVTVPDELTDAVDRGALGAVLGAVSTRAADLDGEDERTVVTTDGRFRVGTLRGRHAKAAAEHVGVTARRAALERQRAEAAALLAEATAALQATEAALDAAGERLGEALELRRGLPPADAAAEAAARARISEEAVDQARRQRDDRRAQRAAAEAAHAQAVDGARRLAATLGLPADRAGLHQVDEQLTRAAAQCDRARGALAALRRAVRDWQARGRDWARATEDHAEAGAELARLEEEHDPLAARLATLEDAVGAAYAEVVAALDGTEGEREATGRALVAARGAQLDATGAASAAEERAVGAARRRAEADARCVAALPGLRGALAVPGLLAAAASDALDADALDADADADASGADDAAVSARPPLPAVAETPEGVRQLAEALRSTVPAPVRAEVTAEGVRQSVRQRRDALGAGWDAEDRQPDESLPLHLEVTGPLGRMPLPEAGVQVRAQLRQRSSLLTAKQDQALRNLLQGLIAREVAEKLHAAAELVGLMNRRLHTVRTSQGIGVSLRWRRRDDLDAGLVATMELLAKPPDLRTPEQDRALTAALAERLADARRLDPDAPYRELVASVLDYRGWHRMSLVLHRPGRSDEQLGRRTALSEGEKKMVSYLPLFAAVAASCDALAAREPAAPRFVLLDDAFAKVSEDNHAKLFGLLVELDLDFIATSERLWGTHATVPELAITEVLRDADLGVIVLEHFRWDGLSRAPARG